MSFLSATETQIMGVLNLTPESFSGPNKLLSAQEIQAAVVGMAKDGARVIDVGAESTRPKAEPISPEEEWRRLEPFVNNLYNILSDPALERRPLISIDTYHAKTVERLRPFAIDIINDVAGVEMEQIAALLRGTERKYVLVHNCGRAATRYLEEGRGAMEQLLCWFSEKIDNLLQCGLKKDQIWLDPGIGFGKTPEQTANIIQEIDRLKALGHPLVLGHSRKGSALPAARHLPPIERDLETAYLSRYFAKRGIDYVRVHNCLLNRRVMDAHISMIVAHQKDRGIGYHNQLPWKLVEDKKRFKALTMGKRVVMGRNTFESIGAPLKERRNCVLSSTPLEGVETFSSLADLFIHTPPEEEIMLIGGEHLYQEGVKCADTLYLTLVEATEKVDTFFPQLEEKKWRSVEQTVIGEPFPYVMKKMERIW